MQLSVGVDKRHAFKKGMNGEPDKKSRDGVEVVLLMLGMVVFCGVIIMAFLTVIVTVFDAAGQPFEQHLDNEADENSHPQLDMGVGSVESGGVHVWHQVDET